MSFTVDTKPALPTPLDLPNPFEFQPRVPNTSRTVDLDGMNLISDGEVGLPSIPDPNMGLELDLEPVAESPEEDVEEMPWGNDPATASWGPLMAEVTHTSQ